MIRPGLIGALAILAACRGERRDVSEETSAGPRPPARLLGEWVAVAPAALRGDTLRLREDYTASAIIPWGDRFARIHRWKLIYGSKDPVDSRHDWRQGYTDGGDPECIFGNGQGCVSLPMLCLGAAQEYSCSPFVHTGDSLLLASGLRYVRVPRRAPPADSGSRPT